MKFLLLSTVLVFAVSCSSSKEVMDKVPEMAKEPVKQLPESLPAVVTDTSAPAPEINTNDSSELPDITGDSVLDINCAAGQDRRVISILKRTDDRGWGVTYTKFGTTKTIAIARNDKGFCEEVAGRVKGVLQSAGFQCDGDVEASAPPAGGDTDAEKAGSMMDKAKAAAGTATDGAGSMLDKAKAAAGSATDGAGSMLDKAKAAAGSAADGAGSMMDKAKEKAGEAVDAVKGE